VDADFDRLLTRRLVIRRFAASDAEAFARYRSLPEVARYQSWEAPYAIERARAFVDWMETHHPDERGEWYQFAISTRDDPTTLIGDCAFHGRAAEPLIADIGYTMDPASQGLGYGTEAVGELVRYLIEDRGKHKVCADCDTRNQASWRLLERLGFRREGEIRGAFRDGDGWASEYLYGMLADDWRGRTTLGTKPPNGTGSTP
jgi:RimJ/RimL family protein N-acetyltransferase